MTAYHGKAHSLPLLPPIGNFLEQNIPLGVCGGRERPHLKQQLRASWRAPLSHGDAFMGCDGRSEPVERFQ
jgi:hypothetical protein